MSPPPNWHFLALPQPPGISNRVSSFRIIRFCFRASIISNGCHLGCTPHRTRMPRNDTRFAAPVRCLPLPGRRSRTAQNGISWQRHWAGRLTLTRWQAKLAGIFRRFGGVPAEVRRIMLAAFHGLSPPLATGRSRRVTVMSQKAVCGGIGVFLNKMTATDLLQESCHTRHLRISDIAFQRGMLCIMPFFRFNGLGLRSVMPAKSILTHCIRSRVTSCLV